MAASGMLLKGGKMAVGPAAPGSGGRMQTEACQDPGCGCKKGGVCCGPEYGCPPVVLSGGDRSYRATMVGAWSFSEEAGGELVRYFPPAAVSTGPYTDPGVACPSCFTAGYAPTFGEYPYSEFCKAGRWRAAPYRAYHNLRICTREIHPPRVGDLCAPLSLVQPDPGKGGASIPFQDVGLNLATVGLQVTLERAGSIVRVEAARGVLGTSVGGGVVPRPGMEREYFSAHEFDVDATFNGAGCCTRLEATWNFVWHKPDPFWPTTGSFQGSASLVVEYSDCAPAGGGGEPALGGDVTGGSGRGDVGGGGVPASLVQGANFGCVGCGG